MLRIGLDIDQVICDFFNSYIKRFGTPKTDYEITKNVHRKLSTDRNFWLTLPKLRDIDFVPELYCTKRVNPKSWTKNWLHNNGFADRPIYQMLYQKGNKANFIKMNKSGVPCLLMDTPFNQDAGPILRIYSLDIQEIKYAYNLGLESNLFSNFDNMY